MTPEEHAKALLRTDDHWCALNEYGECHTFACYKDRQFVGCPLKRVAAALAEKDAEIGHLQRRVAELELEQNTTSAPPLDKIKAAAKIEGLRMAKQLWREDLRGFKELIDAEIDALLAVRNEATEEKGE